jgi:hypothetical protein
MAMITLAVLMFIIGLVLQAVVEGQDVSAQCSVFPCEHVSHACMHVTGNCGGACLP